MFKFLKKIKRNDGFTLTEVMIGMSILTIAIVSSTNLVMGLMKANSNNVKTLQAYYLAQEGIELVRNVRDTNWLHNSNWLDGLKDDEFFIGRKDMGPVSSTFDGKRDALIEIYGPWDIQGDGEIVFFINNSSEDEVEGTDFTRTMTIAEAALCDEEVFSTNCDYKLVTAEITWKDGANDREFTLDTILTNWKNGVF